MHVLEIPDATGHSTVEFDLKNEASVRAAEETFNKLMKEGCYGAKHVPGGDPVLTRSFDPTAEKTSVHRQNVGG